NDAIPLKEDSSFEILQYVDEALTYFLVIFAPPVISAIESDQASVSNSDVNSKEILNTEVYPVLVSEISSSFEESMTSNGLNPVTISTVPFNNQFKHKPIEGIELRSKLDESYETFHDYSNGDIGCPSKDEKMFYNRNSSMEQNVKRRTFTMVSEIEHQRALELGTTAYEEQPVISVIESGQSSVSNSDINTKETLNTENVYPVLASEINSSF
ncbi:hypothetical protein CEXT_784831, partial [Caerostris extrusa]